jgi:hypothetical protein
VFFATRFNQQETKIRNSNQVIGQTTPDFIAEDDLVTGLIRPVLRTLSSCSRRTLDRREGPDARIRSRAATSCARQVSRGQSQRRATTHPKPPKPTSVARPAGREHRSWMRARMPPRSTKSYLCSLYGTGRSKMASEGFDHDLWILLLAHRRCESAGRTCRPGRWRCNSCRSRLDSAQPAILVVRTWERRIGAL